jgi:hypothetical protein
MSWRSMAEWAADTGPENGTEMLVLMSDGQRLVAKYDGWSFRWKTGKECIDTPVAWAPMPEVPTKLIDRQKYIEAERRRLDEVEKSSLE